MRSRTLLALGALAACSTSARPAAAPAANPAARPQVNTGDSLPDRPGPHDPACPSATGGIRWVDTDPHTPFVVSAHGGLREAGRACCAEWAAQGTTWHAVDAFGQVTGTARLTSGDGYDVTQCYELGFTMDRGNAGVGLFAEGELRAPPSAEWRPSEAERAAADRFAGSLAPLLGDQPLVEDHGATGPLFFQIANPSAGTPDHYVVFGGRALVVARVDGHGAVTLIDLFRFPPETYAPVERPIAVFDLDGDGVPEIIAHWNAGDSWSDYVLRLDDRGRGFREVAESVGGSTA